MHTGKIKKIVSGKNFGFISDAEGSDVFFHKNNLVDIDFETLSEGVEVEFEVENSPKGTSATNVHIASK